MTALSSTLLALADEKRRGVVQALAERQVSAGELAGELEVTPAVLTRHLRVLRDAGLIRATLDPYDQRRHVYELQVDPLRELRDWADGISTFWEHQLTAFADYAEQSRQQVSTGRSRGNGTRGRR
jgi:DNA-binding transcriptional ArsR family regulator